MSNLVKFAQREMKLAGIDKETQALVLAKMRSFASEGHSGASAAYALGAIRPRTAADRIFKQLASFTPLTPLTGARGEWLLVTDYPKKLWQNTRCSSVFKDSKGAYDIEARPVYVDEEGYFTSSKDSGSPVEFPYDVAKARARFRRRKPRKQPQATA